MNEINITPDSLTNRHCAKLLARLKFLGLPQMAEEDIMRQMHFLKEDLTTFYKGKSDNETKKTE